MTLQKENERLRGLLREIRPTMPREVLELWCKDRDAALSQQAEPAPAQSRLVEALAEVDALRKDAERYRWLRNPDQDVALVLDKVTGEIPVDKFGCGGYRTYEYRAGVELDDAIDAALSAQGK